MAEFLTKLALISAVRHHPWWTLAIIVGVLCLPYLLGLIAGWIARLMISPERAREFDQREALRADFHAQMRHDQEQKAARLMRAHIDQLDQ